MADMFELTDVEKRYIDKGDIIRVSILAYCRYCDQHNFPHYIISHGVAEVEQAIKDYQENQT